MALSKVRVIDKIEILEDGTLQVREAMYIEEDSVRIAGPNYHRSTLRPGEATDGQHARIVAVAAAVWTTEVLQAEADKKEAIKGA